MNKLYLLYDVKRQCSFPKGSPLFDYLNLLFPNAIGETCFVHEIIELLEKVIATGRLYDSRNTEVLIFSKDAALKSIFACETLYYSELKTIVDTLVYLGEKVEQEPPFWPHVEVTASWHKKYTALGRCSTKYHNDRNHFTFDPQRPQHVNRVLLNIIKEAPQPLPNAKYKTQFTSGSIREEVNKYLRFQYGGDIYTLPQTTVLYVDSNLIGTLTGSTYASIYQIALATMGASVNCDIERCKRCGKST